MWGRVGGWALFLGWLTTLAIVATDTSSTGTGFGRLPHLVILVVASGGFAFLGLLLLLSAPTRSAGSIFAALWGGFAVGLALGLLTMMLR